MHTHTHTHTHTFFLFSDWLWRKAVCVIWSFCLGGLNQSLLHQCAGLTALGMDAGSNIRVWIHALQVQVIVRKGGSPAYQCLFEHRSAFDDVWVRMQLYHLSIRSGPDSVPAMASVQFPCVVTCTGISCMCVLQTPDVGSHTTTIVQTHENTTQTRSTLRHQTWLPKWQWN